MSAPRVLIIEGDLAEAQILEEAIFEIPERQGAECGENTRRFWWNARVLHAHTLGAALSAVRDGDPDIILLNPAVPSEDGQRHKPLDIFRMLRVQAADLPIVLLLEDGACPDGDETGRRALREGAQDYIWKSRCDWQSLAHAMENALERSRLVKALWESFLFDPQTGLPNRSGFVYMADMLQTALCRVNKPVWMLVGVLDAAASELEVLAAADAIRSCVNDGDLTGRVGQRQFAVLSPELDLAELAARLVQCQPPGGAGRGSPRLHWSRWEHPAGSVEPVEKLLRGAESMIGSPHRAFHASPGSLQ